MRRKAVELVRKNESMGKSIKEWFNKFEKEHSQSFVEKIVPYFMQGFKRGLKCELANALEKSPSFCEKKESFDKELSKFGNEVKEFGEEVSELEKNQKLKKKDKK